MKSPWPNFILILLIIVHFNLAPEAWAAVWLPGPDPVLSEADYPKLIVWPKEKNLLHQDVTDIAHFDLFDVPSHAILSQDTYDWKNTLPPEVSFNPKTHQLWKELGFGNNPVLLSSVNAHQLLKVPVLCQKSVEDVFKLVREYAFDYSNQKFDLASEVWKKIRQKLMRASSDQYPCQRYVRNSYIVAATSVFDVSASMAIRDSIQTENGFRLARNAPMILLSAYLFNSDKLELFSKDQVNRTDGLDKVDQAVYGAYECESHTIYLWDQLLPFNLAGSFYHELSHAFRDTFMNLNIWQKVTPDKLLLLDEAVALFTGAQSQLDLVDHFQSAQVRSRSSFSLPNEDQISTDQELRDFNLFNTKGSLSHLFYTFYDRPEFRSQLPGVSPSILPLVRPSHLSVLDLLLPETFLRREKRTQDEVSRLRQQYSEKILQLVGDAYFHQSSQSDSSTPVSSSQDLTTQFNLNFDPFSQFLTKASRFLLIDGKLVQKVVPYEGALEESQDFAKLNIKTVQKTNGETYRAILKTEMEDVSSSPYQKVKIKMKNSDELFTVTYDLHTLLSWMAYYLKGFSQSSQSCEKFNKLNKSDLNDYLGKQISIKRGPYSLKPGGFGIKPESDGVQPGGFGVKPDQGVRPGGFGIRPGTIIFPNVPVPNL